MGRAHSRLTIAQILSWADDHHANTGEWPRQSSGIVLANPQERWRRIDAALRRGSRGLPGKSSLAKLLYAKKRLREPRLRGRPPGSERPYQALALRSEGLSFAEIGRRMGVSRQRAHEMVNKAKQS